MVLLLRILKPAAQQLANCDEQHWPTTNMANSVFRIEWGPHENPCKFAQNICMGRVDSGQCNPLLGSHCSTGFPHSTFQHVFWENATITE
jgi:hypothetical protein